MWLCLATQSMETQLAATRGICLLSHIGTLICPAGHGTAGAGSDTLRPYVAFHAALRSAYNAFISRLEGQCRGLVRHHLDAATSEFAATLTAAAG